MKLSKIMTIPLLLIMVFSLAACGGGASSSDNNTNNTDNANNNMNNTPSTSTGDNGEIESITLKFASIVPNTHDLYTYGAKVFMEKVEELSGGKIKIDHFPDGQLGKPADMINLANTGVAELVEVAPSYIPGKLVLGNAFQLPGALPDPEIGSKVIWDVIKSENSVIRQSDFANNGLVPLYAATLPLYQIVTNENKPIDSLDDLKGLKLRSAGGVQDLIVEALGAVPVAMDRTEVYQALQRGTLDGGVFNLPSLKANQTIDVLKYTTTNANLTSFVCALAISESVWNNLSDNVKNILLQAGEAAAQSLAESVMKSDQNALQELINDYSYSAWTLTSEEVEQMKEMVMPVWDSWVADVEKLGFDGKAAIEEMNAALKNYQ